MDRAAVAFRSTGTGIDTPRTFFDHPLPNTRRTPRWVAVEVHLDLGAVRSVPEDVDVGDPGAAFDELQAPYLGLVEEASAARGSRVADVLFAGELGAVLRAQGEVASGSRRGSSSSNSAARCSNSVRMSTGTGGGLLIVKVLGGVASGGPTSTVVTGAVVSVGAAEAAAVVAAPLSTG